MVKEKPNSTRIYDKDGFRQRAACICVRSVDENEVSEIKFIFLNCYCNLFIVSLNIGNKIDYFVIVDIYCIGN